MRRGCRWVRRRSFGGGWGRTGGAGSRREVRLALMEPLGLVRRCWEGEMEMVGICFGPVFVVFGGGEKEAAVGQRVFICGPLLVLFAFS